MNLAERIFGEGAKVTQEFGEEIIINGKKYYQSCGMKGHNGIDFRASVGTPIKACISGMVQVKNDKTGYGVNIRIKNDKYEVIYAHLKGSYLKNGERVVEGALIGETGNTGSSTGPHLHFGIRELDRGIVKNYTNGYYGRINPDNVFQSTEYSNLPQFNLFNIQDGDYTDFNISKAELKELIQIGIYRYVDNKNNNTLKKR